MDILNCLEYLKNLENLQPSDFLYVGLKQNKGSNQVFSSKHFVGQVIEMEENDVRTSGSSFIWPEVEDIRWTSRDDNDLFLSVPFIDRRHHFTFIDTDQINMINCCK